MDTELIKQVLRRLDNIEKTQNIQFEDRNILEDVLRKISDLYTVTKLLTDRVEKLEKLQRVDNKDMLDKMDEIKDNTEEVSKAIAS